MSTDSDLYWSAQVQRESFDEGHRYAIYVQLKALAEQARRQAERSKDTADASPDYDTADRSRQAIDRSISRAIDAALRVAKQEIGVL